MTVNAELWLCSVIFMCKRKETHGMTWIVKMGSKLSYAVKSVEKCLQLLKLYFTYLNHFESDFYFTIDIA